MIFFLRDADEGGGMMMIRRWSQIALGAGLFSAAGSALAGQASPDAAALVAGTAGKWKGELQYRDYESNRWEGLPMEVTVAVQPDGVTTLRTARYDDGPKTGFVTITTASLVDPAAATLSYATLRKGRALDSGQARITAVTPGKDPEHWTLVTAEERIDGNGKAQVRETTVREGDRLTTLKEVDPLGDGKTEWLPRNRTLLTRVGS
jgi:hypothetical protein